MMCENNAIFERYEIKYLVSDRQAEALRQALQEKMVPDAYGESTVCNVYFDTPDFRLVRRSLEKPLYKEKFRMRSYGPVKGDGQLFLELKKKYRGVVYKRRMLIPEDAAMRYLLHGGPMPQDSQIGREIDYMIRYYGKLAPAVYLSYDRTALFSREDSNLRLTFDRNIRWSDAGLSLREAPHGQPLLRPDETLLEIKTASAIPAWFTALLAKQRLYPVSFSKYGSAYTELLAEIRMRGVHCA